MNSGFCDYHHIWMGSLCLVKFQILHIFVWTMMCHNNLCGRKLGHHEEPIHFEFHSSQRESFWRWSRCETSQTTWSVLEPYRELHKILACSCASYCEVELSRPITHIWPCKQSLWFYAWRMLSFCPCEYSSEFCLEVLIWGNKDIYLLVEVADSILIKWNWWHLLLS